MDEKLKIEFNTNQKPFLFTNTCVNREVIFIFALLK